MQNAILLIFIIGNLLLALTVLHNNPKSWTNRLFTILVLILTAYLTINTQLYIFQSHTTRLLLARSIIALGAIINLLVYLFLTTFPKDTLPTPKKWLLPLSTITGLLFAAGFTPLIFSDITIQNQAVVPTPGPLMPIFLIHTISLIFGGIASIFLRYRKSVGLERTRIRFVFFSFLILFSLIIILNFIVTVFLKFGNFVPFLPAYILIFNLMITYAITRHRLLEIRFLVARTVTFTLLTLIVSLIYGYSLLLIPRFIPAQYQTIASVLVALFLAYTFAPMRQYLQLYTEKIFHKRGYFSEALLAQLTDTTSSTLNLNQIVTKVSQAIQTTMHVSSAAFLLITKTNDGQPTITAKSFDFDTTPQLDLNQIKSIAAHNQSQSVIFEDLEEGPIKQLFRDQHVSVALPLKVGAALHGLLLLGEKESGDIYSSQDIGVLDIFTPTISVAIQNSLAYDQIKSFNATLRQKIDEATRDLRKANKDLRRLDKLKDEFVFVATHELKTPVAVLNGYLNMLREGTYGQVPSKITEPLGELRAATDQLQVLVNDLLEIARSESKTLQIETKPTPLCATVDDTLGSLQTLADQKKLKLNHVCKDKKLQVMASPDRLKEITNNLISNAIKYSDSGTITINHIIDQNQVVTHVIDQGIGMSPVDQQKVFSRFFRSQERSGSTPGTGLGLFIVKQLVEKMGGKIWFTSKRGEGTTFSFSLPKA